MTQSQTNNSAPSARDSLRIGILGASRVARYAVIRPARKVLRIAVDSIASRDAARARKFAQHFAVPRIHPTYDALLADPAIDAVYIGLPNALHAPWSIRALEAGKHVLCEKPLASNESEASAIADAALRANRVFMEGMHYRYHPLPARMRELAQQLGPLRSIDIWNCFPVLSRNDIRYQLALSGGALMDLGSYAVNLLRFLVPGEVDVAFAEARLRGEGIDRRMQATLRMQGGVDAHMTCSMLSAMLVRSEIRMHGERGTLRVVNPFAPHLFHRMTLRRDGVRTHERLPSGPTTFEYQLRAFAAAIDGDASVVTSAADGAATMRVIDDIYRKAGLPVRGS